MSLKRNVRRIFLVILFLSLLILTYKLPQIFISVFDNIFLSKTYEIDKSISPDDIVKIKNLAKTVGYRNYIIVSKYDCLKTNNKVNIIDIAIKISKLCITGDYKLATGINTFGGTFTPNLGAEKRIKHYIIRKENSNWVIIEYLGESVVIS